MCSDRRGITGAATGTSRVLDFSGANTVTALTTLELDDDVHVHAQEVKILDRGGEQLALPHPAAPRYGTAAIRAVSAADIASMSG